MRVKTAIFFAMGFACSSPRQPAGRISSDSPSALPAIVADARFALEVSSQVAKYAWKDWAPGAIPFVIVYEHEQWIFRSSSAPPGYDPRPVSSGLGPVFRAPAWTQYDGTHVANSPPRFFAQADRFDGAMFFTIVAARYAPFSAPDWATVFTHEYFHIFQLKDERWAGDPPKMARPLRDRLNRLYTENRLFRETVTRELDAYRGLLGALSQGGDVDCHNFQDALQARQARVLLLREIDSQLPDAEQALERFEGIARYVEESAYDHEPIVRILRARDRSWHPTSADNSLNRRLGVVDGEYFYATGYALARLLDICNPAWKTSFGAKDLGALL